MARLEVLDTAARQDFEQPPHFLLQQRAYFFSIPDWIQAHLDTLDTPVNRVGFVLQWGYFKAAGRFFKIPTFTSADIRFVANQLSIDPLGLDFTTYPRNTVGRHRQLIREALGFAAFTGVGRVMVQQEARHLVGGRQVHPERVFWNLCAFTRAHRIEVPTYFALCELISEAIRGDEQRLDQILQGAITPDQITLLDELFEKLPPDASGRSIHRTDFHGLYKHGLIIFVIFFATMYHRADPVDQLVTNCIKNESHRRTDFVFAFANFAGIVVL